MLYLVSGASRSGKTIIAERILEEHGIPYLSLDWLVMGFTNGLPQLGIHDKLMPDEIADGIWDYLKAMCESMIWSGIDYVVEGEAILPARIRELIESHPDKVRIVFLGYTTVDVEEKLREIKKHSVDKVDWLTQESDAYIRDHIQNMVVHSRLIREGCAEHDLPYFDTTEDFCTTLEQAKEYLLGNQ
ncbi:MAG: hypothetical protein AB3N64_04840 [Puniceicoccaceae bacterium]